MVNVSILDEMSVLLIYLNKILILMIYCLGLLENMKGK